MVTDISDLFPVFTVNRSMKKKKKKKTVDTYYSRILSEINHNRFKQNISNCNWQEVFTHQDTNIAFE